MAMKPGDLLNQLPSVSELLEKPPIRVLADRWNRSVVAGRVRTFLDELRSDLRRRADELPLPSIRELAERAAHYIVSQQQISLGTAINATGRLRGAPWQSGPLADAALERTIAVGREFVVEKSPVTGSKPLDAEPLLCRLGGAQAAVAVHSYTAALWLALSAVAAEREVLVARAEIGELDLAEPLPKIAAAANVALREVGTINRANAADYEAAATPSTAALLRITPDEYRVVGDTTMAGLDELVALARARQLIFIDVLGAAPLFDPPEPLQLPVRSVRSSLALGVDLAVVRGDGLVGGPSCGIVLGTCEAIRRIAEHPLFASSRLDLLRSAALLATLECYENSPPGRDAIPVWQFLTAPVDNLRNRAERMAAQLAHAEGVSSSVAMETRSQLFPALAEGWPSYAVALTAANGDIQSLDRRLRSGPLPILGRVKGDRLLLDLRTVLPRQDKTLVDALLGAATTPPTATDASHAAETCEPQSGEAK